jgi:hypothetical protein
MGKTVCHFTRQMILKSKSGSEREKYMDRWMVFTFALVLGLTSILLGSTRAFAQNPFENAIKQLDSDMVRGYLQPFLDGFGANMNSGFSGSSDISTRFHLRLDIVGMATLVGGAQKTYKATPPLPFPQQEVETATIFGGNGALITGPNGLQYYMQNGQLNVDFIPFAIPQLTMGNVFGTQAVFRYFLFSGEGDIPSVNLFGLGLRHQVSRYLPSSPVDVSATIFYQNFSIGDIMDSNAMAYGLKASRKFSVFSLYGGLQYESSNVDLTYTFTGFGSDIDQEIDLSLKGENNLRFYAGAGLSLGFLHLRGDVGLGKVTTLSVAIGFGN